jgi:hypothetical protein
MKQIEIEYSKVQETKGLWGLEVHQYGVKKKGSRHVYTKVIRS